MRTIALIITITLMMVSLEAAAQPFRLPDPPTPPTPQQAYEQLLAVRSFTFGGVYIGGEGSPGERACRIIARSTNALTLFSAAFTNGNAQAKCYALCGIRQFSPAMFDSYAKSLRIANPIVDTTRTDAIHREAATNVIARIASGSYDSYLQKWKR